MKGPVHVAAACVTLFLCPADVAQAQTRAKADVTCKPAGAALHYDCIIKLVEARGNAPLSGVTLSVGANMPSMPGMHHLRPVQAVEDEKGTYRAQLILEMHGDWALALNVSGKMRDRVIKALRFEPDRVEEAKSAGKPKAHGN